MAQKVAGAQEGGRKETGKGESPRSKGCEWVTLGKRAETEL